MKKYLHFSIFLFKCLSFCSLIAELESRPNILFFLVDEWRFPTSYETDELKEWKKKNLVFQTMLTERGTTFQNHYTNSNACCPARACLHTGHYIHVHGVTQTDGAAKSALSPDMTWLHPFTVPTIGNFLMETGYQSILKGKWHVTDASIRLESGDYLTTFDKNGFRIPSLYHFYLSKNVLHDFGYDRWVGPDPHGISPLNSGSSVKPPAVGADETTTKEVIDELHRLFKTNQPWFLIASYVNPHDIALFGEFTRLNKQANWFFPVDPTLPEKLFKEEFQLSLHENLFKKPRAQREYRDLYPQAFQPIRNIDRYQRFYYTLQKKVDQEMLKVWEKLVANPAYKNTIIVFTSDHGDLLASHGKMFQKWYQAYQEAIHVPLIISSPLFGNKHQKVSQLTSHIDILPTILDFAKGNAKSLNQKLSRKFSLTLPLPGKSLLSSIKHPKRKRGPVYFYTEDNPLEGPNQVNGQCQPYSSVNQPAAVEAVLAIHEGNLWKLTHYYNTFGNCGNKKGITHELYNVSQDPMELNSLYRNPEFDQIKEQLTRLMETLSAVYRIIPNEVKNQEFGEE